MSLLFVIYTSDVRCGE